MVYNFSPRKGRKNSATVSPSETKGGLFFVLTASFVTNPKDKGFLGFPFSSNRRRSFLVAGIGSSPSSLINSSPSGFK